MEKEKHSRKGPDAEQTDGNLRENKVQAHQINRKLRDQRNSKLKRSSRNKEERKGRKDRRETQGVMINTPFMAAIRINPNRHVEIAIDGGTITALAYAVRTQGLGGN